MATRVTQVVAEVVVSSTAPTTITPPGPATVGRVQIVWIKKK